MRTLRTTGRPRLVVPAYFHPAVYPEQWAELAEHASQVRLVVLNPASGPGALVDPAFIPVLSRLRAAGVAIAGYVDTNYGRRPPADALADLGRYLDWYGVDGVMFDRVASGTADVRYYASLARSARTLGANEVTFNHGAHPVEAYAEHADLLGTFEAPWRVYLDLAVPRWVRDRPAERFYHLVYSVPRGHLGEAASLAARRNAGGVYVTDLGGDNPWRCLPGHRANPEPTTP
ncbi:MAG: spherulation-specific family 4 protein [Sciscionella sp.]